VDKKSLFAWIYLRRVRLESAASSLSTLERAMANRTLMCIICGFVYDESEGLPEEGIAPGTRWEDIPDDWQCPDCDATKIDFEMIEI